MQAIINVDNATGDNPNFDPIRKSGKDNPRHVAVPRGTVIDNPAAWKLCVGSEPVAEPYDDDCREKVAPILAHKAAEIARREQAATESDDSETEATAEAPAVRTRSRRADTTE